MMSFGVSIPLPWDRANRQDRDVAAKLALADQARAQREDALRAHVAEVAAMLEEWENDRERLALYADSTAAARARAHGSGGRPRYRGGKGTLADVLAARRNELDVRRDALMLERETARLWAQLNFLDVAPARMPPRVDAKEPPMKTTHAFARRAAARRRRSRRRATGSAARTRRTESSAPRRPRGGRRGIRRSRRRRPATSIPRRGRKVLYWHDPMVPGQRFDKPGKSPFMDMMLVPVYADGRQRRGHRHDQPARAPEPRRAHGGGHARRAGGAARRRSAASRSTSATRRSCRRARTATSRSSSCARRSTRCAAASRSPSSTCPTGSPRRRSIWPCAACAAPGIDALVDARAPAHAPGRHVRRADRARRSERATCSRGSRSTAPIGGVVDRARRARRHDGRDGHAAVPHQRPRLGVDQRRGAGARGGARAPRQRRSRCARRRCPARVQGPRQRDAARGQRRRRARSRRASRSPIRRRAGARACSRRVDFAAGSARPR